MLEALNENKQEFNLGTFGWTVADLDDPVIERKWERGRHEIADGILTVTPPAFYDSGRALSRLGARIQGWLDEHELAGGMATEVDLVLAPSHVARVDFLYLTEKQERRQKAPSRQRGRKGIEFGRIVVTPELVIESISIGHEHHDQTLKRRWYADAGIPNYWLLHAYKKTLESDVG